MPAMRGGATKSVGSGSSSTVSLKEWATVGQAASSSSQQPAASSSGVVVPAEPALSSSCSRCNANEEIYEIASTAASSEPSDDAEQDLSNFLGMDFAESDDEQPGPSCPAASEVASASCKARWADLDDSEEEPSSPNASSSACPAPSAAHFVPSDKLQRLAPKVLGAAPSKSQRKSAKKATPVDGEAAWTWPTKKVKAGRNKATCNQDQEWWVHDYAAAEWGTKVATWWDSGAYEGEWWQDAGSSWWPHEQTSWASRGGASGRSHIVDRRGSAAAGAIKPQCQFYIGIEECKDFKVTRKILGPYGRNMKSIAEASGAKLRLRGRGSGFLEGEDGRESTDELMLCISAPDWDCYQEAVSQVTALLKDIYEQYRTWTQKATGVETHVEIRLHEGPRPGSR
eukprot:SRR837773.11580.p1 GENE.SRR837773.11580~~SRR837773.11580.p1  ORF type:complete len:398 (-),score=65.96 SRR837773.11580:258-1451(-)